MALNLDTLKKMMRMVGSTRPDEIGCDDCFAQLDQFAEQVLAGKNAAEAMPLVQDHLDRCGDCREEFEALLRALRAESTAAA
jgi:predicted anti-sigma-YlaC factor YlaD